MCQTHKTFKLTWNFLLPKAVAHQGFNVLHVPAGKVFLLIRVPCFVSESILKCASTVLIRSLFTSVSGRPPGRGQWARTTAVPLCASAACSNPETAGRCDETELRHMKDNTKHHLPACFYDQTRGRHFTRKHLSHRVCQMVCGCRDGRKKSGNDRFCRNTRLGEAWSEDFFWMRMSRTKKKHTPAPLWASKLMNSTVPSCAVLLASRYSTCWPPGQNLKAWQYPTRNT